jgi:hypothetical protein
VLSGTSSNGSWAGLSTHPKSRTSHHHKGNYLWSPAFPSGLEDVAMANIGVAFPGSQEFRLPGRPDGGPPGWT